MIDVPFTYAMDWENVPIEQWPETMLQLAECGAKNIVFSDDMISNIAVTPKFSDDLRSWLNNAGLNFVDAHAQFSPGATFTAPDDLRPLAFARWRFEMQLMADMGIKNCCFHVGKNAEYSGMSVAEGRDNIRKALELVIPEAEKLGITICIENIFHPLNNVRDLLTFIREFPSPNLGICYDCGHANIMENKEDQDNIMYNRWQLAHVEKEDILWETDVLGDLFEHIVMCHLHDNNGLRDQHMLPGQGNVDIKKVLKRLEAAPRLSSMQSEVLPIRNGNSVAELCSCWQQLLLQ